MGNNYFCKKLYVNWGFGSTQAAELRISFTVRGKEESRKPLAAYSLNH